MNVDIDYLWEAFHKELPKGDYYAFLSYVVGTIRPQKIVELGTGTGRSSAAMMRFLPVDCKLFTINWPNPPSGDNVGIELQGYDGDSRIVQIRGDSRDKEIAVSIGGGIDMMFVDSGTRHCYDLVSAEWALWEPYLYDTSLILFDDIDVNDMPRFWDELTHKKRKIELHQSFGFGIVEYRRCVG